MTSRRYSDVFIVNFKHVLQLLLGFLLLTLTKMFVDFVQLNVFVNVTTLTMPFLIFIDLL